MNFALSADQARNIVLRLQGLAESPRRTLDSDGLHALIDTMGFVQLDSINTVARAHHMILRSRVDGYRPAHLTRLLERERRLFENWTHDASVIPTAFFRHWRRRFLRDLPRMTDRYNNWHGDEFHRRLDAVLGRIADEGPLMAKDFGEGRQKPSGGWWNWHEDKIALEFLWRTGRLSVAGRQGFQKVYDLTERVVPDLHAHEPSEPEDYVDWACRSALERLGFGAPGDIARFWDLVSVDEAKAWCEGALARGDALPVTVAAADGSPPRKMVARPDIEALASDMAELPDRMRTLSPFDPLIRDRKRLERLFGFDYRIEVFVPAEKRRYGYYVFPLMERDRMIGRVDMTANRDRDALMVTALWPEPGVKLGKGRLARLHAEFERLRRFAKVGTIEIADDWLRAPLPPG